MLDERVGDLLAAVDPGDEHEQGAPRDDQAEGAGGLVAVVIYVGKLVRRAKRRVLGRHDLPRMISLTSSRTRFMSWS